MKIAIKEALFRRGHELGREISGAEALRIINDILKETDCQADGMRRFWTDPEQSLGAFADLPAEVRSGLAESALFSFREEHALSSPRLTRTVHGARTRLGYRLIRWGWLLVQAEALPGGALLMRLGRKLVRSARDRGLRLLARTRFTDSYRMPLAYALWIYCDCDVLGLIQDYIEDIPIDRRFCPVWKSEALNSESGMIVGLDMLMHDGDVYFVESNINPAFHADRLEYHPDGDPLCRDLVDYAVENGYKRIVFCPANVVSHFVQMKYLMGIALEESWRAMATEKDIELEVTDSPLLGSPYKRKAEVFMPSDARDTLFVNVRDMPSPLSRILGIKGKLEDRIPAFNEGRPEAERLHSPRTFLSDADLPSIDLNPRFPNLIVKDTRLDMARGINMYKCRTLPPDANDGTKQAFEYVVPDCVHTTQKGVTGDFVCNFRSYLMLTPDGPRYLAVKKNITSDPVLDSLDEGYVRQVTSYISNLHLGGYTIQASAEEDAACKRFSLSVGELLYGLLRKRHGSFIR